jgi:hypothetical protein
MLVLGLGLDLALRPVREGLAFTAQALAFNIQALALFLETWPWSYFLALLCWLLLVNFLKMVTTVINKFLN